MWSHLKSYVLYAAISTTGIVSISVADSLSTKMIVGICSIGGLSIAIAKDIQQREYQELLEELCESRYVISKQTYTSSVKQYAGTDVEADLKHLKEEDERLEGKGPYTHEVSYFQRGLSLNTEFLIIKPLLSKTERNLSNENSSMAESTQ